MTTRLISSGSTSSNSLVKPERIVLKRSSESVETLTFFSIPLRLNKTASVCVPPTSIPIIIACTSKTLNLFYPFQNVCTFVCCTQSNLLSMSQKFVRKPGACQSNFHTGFSLLEQPVVAFFLELSRHLIY